MDLLIFVCLLGSFGVCLYACYCDCSSLFSYVITLAIVGWLCWGVVLGCSFVGLYLCERIVWLAVGVVGYLLCRLVLMFASVMFRFKFAILFIISYLLLVWSSGVLLLLMWLCWFDFVWWF